MVFNWLWNFKYSKEHVKATITIQKYVRGFIARKRVDQILEDLEQKKQVMLVWHTIMKQTKQIQALSENTQMDFETSIEMLPTYHQTMRAYIKQRSTMVERILNLDGYIQHLNNVGDPLPTKMFPVKSLFIQGTKIIPCI